MAAAIPYFAEPAIPKTGRQQSVDVTAASVTTTPSCSSTSSAGEVTTSKEMALTTRILQDYFKMMRVQIIGESNNTSPTFVLETPNPKLMFTPIELPTTAELMQRCLAVNPFEAKFREANQKINSGTAMPPLPAANQSIEALEANGLVPMNGAATTTLSTTASMTDLLLKIPPSSLQQSPGIFSNISILQAAGGGGDEVTTRENLKTADISKFLSAVGAGDSSAQAPRTADVLNAVLDMHSDRLHTINYLNKPDFSALLRSPSSSAPNSASILGVAMVPSTSCNGFLGPSRPTPVSGYSPMVATSSSSATAATTADGTAVTAAAVVAAAAAAAMQKSPEVATSTVQWDLKPVKKEVSYYPDDQMSLMSIGHNSTGNLSTSDSEREVTPQLTNGPNPVGRPPNSTPGRGRGRGRSTTADMPPDERRNTILERNKAAAVRYRKRKKEEHDDMLGRVQNMEQEKNTLHTQNQVLRRELDRLRGLLQEREQRCVCLKGIQLSSDHRSDSPHIDVLGTCGNGMYSNDQHNLMLNGLGAPLSGMHLKRPKM